MSVSGKRDWSRRQRVGPLLQRELDELLRHEFHDPRLDGLTVTEVDLSPDLRHARVYVSRLGRSVEESLEVLATLGGRLRGVVCRRLHLRYAPRLEFVADLVPDRAARISSLIDRGRGSGPAGD